MAMKSTLTGAVMARFGLIPLVARGYGYITYGYLAVFVLPVLTWGVVLVNRNREGAGGEPRVR